MEKIENKEILSRSDVWMWLDLNVIKDYFKKVIRESVLVKDDKCSELKDLVVLRSCKQRKPDWRQ